eukprot:6928139-Pyramimonas_sp.AAC.1
MNAGGGRAFRRGRSPKHAGGGNLLPRSPRGQPPSYSAASHGLGVWRCTVPVGARTDTLMDPHLRLVEHHDLAWSANCTLSARHC